MATATGSSAQSRFLLTPEMMSGAIYRKYEKATRKFWDPKELDYSRDAADWERMTEDQRNGILTITVRIEAGEEAVTDELLPMLSASHELGRFDWVMFLSTFMLDEARHSEFFNIWHREVAGISTPAEKAAHWPLRDHTVDPTGRFQVGEPVYEGIPKYGDALMAAVQSRNREAIAAGFVRFSTLYNAWVEGVLTMPTYEIVMDTTAAWGVLPTLQAGFGASSPTKVVTSPSGRSPAGYSSRRTRATRRSSTRSSTSIAATQWACSSTSETFRGSISTEYQRQKVRHYRNRCREMGVAADETLVEQILDPSIDFVTGVQAG